MLVVISLAAYGKKDPKDHEVTVKLRETGVSKVECAVHEGTVYKCVVHSDGVNDGILVLAANVYIDSEKEVITKVTTIQNGESDEYGKALLGGTLRIPDVQTFYNKYVNIGADGKSIYKPADLETGATGTAAACVNIIKAAVEKYTTTVVE